MAAAATFADQAAFGQHPVHLAFRAQVGAFVEQGRVHLGRGQIPEPLRAQLGDDAVLLLVAQRRRMRPARRRFPWRAGPGPALGGLAAMPEGAGVDPERRAGAGHPDPCGERLHVRVEHHAHFGSALWREICCKSADTFPCASINSVAVASSSSSLPTR